MTIYAVYTRERDKAGLESRAIAERFSWSATLFAPLWMLAHGLAMEFILWLAFVIALVVASDFIGDGASFWLYVLAAILIGFEAGALRRAALVRGGWHYRGEAVAGTADVAEAECLGRVDTKKGWA